MNAVAGLFARDERPLPSASLDMIATTLARRGALTWQRTGGVALAAVTSAPDEADGIVVAAAARIDNASDLTGRLGLPSGAMAEAIIAAAYRRWGEDCPAHLLGDFAFMLWDPHAQRLLCARDALGVTPFYYHLSDRLFAAATTQGALTAVPDIGAVLDNAAMASFVAGRVTDTTSTLYAQVQRLAPAHSLMVDRGTARIRRYWRPEDAPDVLASEAAERFRNIFVDSVRARVGDWSRCGVMLSGGLDSSSIAAVVGRDVRAAGQRASTLSLTFDPQAGWNEGPFIDVVLAQGGLDPIFIDSRDHDPVADLAAILEEQEGPFLGYNASVSQLLYRRARSEGLTLLLDGHGGDEIVSHGIGRLNELARAGRWWAMLRESSGVAAINGLSLHAVAWPYASHNRAVRAMQSRWRARRPVDDAVGAPDGTELVAPELAGRTELAARMRAVQIPRRASATERDEHIAMIADPLQPYALEVLDRSAAAAGVTPAYPFYDRRLVELCVGAPSETKLAGGLPRLLLRDAMKGILPESVRLRRDKFNFAGELANGLLRHRDTIIRMVERDEGGIGRFVNRQVATTALERLVASGQSTDGPELFKVWRTLALGLWLSRHA